MRVVLLLGALLAFGACSAPRKTTIPVDSPLRPFTAPDERVAEPAPVSQPAQPKR